MTINHAEHLAETVEDLNQEVRILREAIDELRETIQWISQNKSADQTYGILKAMGRDVVDASWNERLKIDSGPSAIVGQRENLKPTERDEPHPGPQSDGDHSANDNGRQRDTLF